jgi:hypothetical protein
VLEHARPGDRAVLGHVTDQDRGHVARLGRGDQRGRDGRTWVTPPALPSAAGEAIVCTESTTSRPGSTVSTWPSSAARSVSAGQVEPGVQRAGALGPQPHLRGRLLAGDDERGAAGRVVPGRPRAAGWTCRPRARRPAAARRPAPAAAEHPVELADAGRPGPAASTSISAIGRAGVVTAPAVTAAVSGRSPTGAAPTSATEPHAWHSGQRPTQRGGVCPHSAHR